MTYILTTATSRDEQERAARLAVLPVGSFEQHSDFLPFITDTVVACVIAERICIDHDLFLLPPITMSCSHEHSQFSGTVSISSATLAATIADVRESLALQGIDRLVIVNGHGGNYVLSNITQEANVAEPRVALFPSRFDWDAARVAAGLLTSTSDDMHAGELEVSILLNSYPDLVGATRGSADWLVNPRPHLLMTGMAHYTKSGVIGSPSLGTAEKGEALLVGLSDCFKHQLSLLSPCTGPSDRG